MHRKTALLIVASLAAVTVLAAPAWGQNTLEAGKKAYLARQYERARDQLEMASRRTPTDPEVFLWLGKAHYQLGQLSGAMAAWRQTLKLAPNEPYAKKMLTALRAEVDDVDVRIMLLEQMLAVNLHQGVRSEGASLLAVKALTDAQRVRIMMLLSEAYTLSGGGETVQWYAAQIRGKFPKLAPEPRLTLLVAMADLKRTGPSVDAALATLKSIVAKHPKSPEAAAAGYELAVFALDRTKATEPLAAWLAAHGDHAKAGPAAKRLAGALLAVAANEVTAGPGTKLHPSTIAAIELLTKQYARGSTIVSARSMTQDLLAHLDTSYARGQAYLAAADGARRLLALPLPAELRAKAARADIKNQTEAILKDLADLGPKKLGALPKDAANPFAEIITKTKALAAQYPRLGAYSDLAAVAERMGQLANLLRELPELPEGKALPTAYRWAVEIAMTVATDSPDAKAKAKAVTTVTSVIEAMFAIADARQAVTPESALHPADITALRLTGRVLPLADRTEATRLVKRIVNHLHQHYAARGANAAVVAATEQLLSMPLSPASQRTVVLTALRFRTAAIMAGLAERAATRGLPTAMPVELAELVKQYARVNQAPVKVSERNWMQTVSLAEQVRGLAAELPAPTEPAGAVGPYEWAVTIALPIVQADADAKAVAIAVKTITAVADAYAGQKAPEGLRLAAASLTPLAEALKAGKGTHRSTVLWKMADILTRQAAWAFNENIRQGRAGANAALSETQGRLLETLGAIVARDRAQAGPVREKLDAHLQLWLAQAEHYAVAEAAYDKLAGSLQAVERRAWKLSLVKLWIQQVSRRHNRLLGAGMALPRELDPIHRKALECCYALQAGLAQDDPFAAQARSLVNNIIVQYEALEYYDVAAEAIAVKPEGSPGVAPADAYARIRLAELHLGQAQRELEALLKRFGGTKPVALTDAFKSVIAEYTQFITDRPTDPLSRSAAERIAWVADMFARHEAYDVAAGIHRDFADFAAGIKVLSHAAPGVASAAELARFRGAGVLYTKAQRALAKQMAESKPKGSPPKALSDEFAAAIGAYVEFIRSHPDGALAGASVRQVMAAAMEYAKVNAWGVAEGVYADLLGEKLPLRRPERLRLAQGLCRLGQVMGDHARGMLRALGTPADKPASKPGGKLGLALLYKVEETASKSRFTADEPNELHGGQAGKKPRPGAGAGPAGRPVKPVAPAPTAEPATGADADLVAIDALAMATIRRESQRQAMRIASLRDTGKYKIMAAADKRSSTRSAQGQRAQVPVLSDAEIARQAKALDGAYGIFAGIRADSPEAPAAAQARGEIMLMISHWRTLTRWERAAKLARQYLADNPTDGQVPSLRLTVARDYLAWATKPITKATSTQERLGEVAKRFAKAREELAGLVRDLPDEKTIVQQAQWLIANSFLTQARAVDAFSSTLARGQYVRGARELRKIAEAYHDHPNIASVPAMLRNVAEQLAGRGYYDEAIIVWTDLYIHYPSCTDAPRRVAQTYQNNLKRPLLAAEAYLELNFTLGGRDVGVQNAILQIGTTLKGEKRWVEALHVLEVFVDSFPRHASAGQALTMVGQIHQANEAWQDAIAAYRRVIEEFPSGAWVREAKWAITDCTINLSRWREAMAACEAYLRAYPKDTRTAEATRRIGILKDLTLFQTLVDEKGQRKAFDAQYQIAEIVRTKLANPVKAIIEYRKVAANWPKSHWADDAMFKVGTTYLQLGETDKARTALLAEAERYPTSPLADDALYQVGLSYQREADQYATVTRSTTLADNTERAQKTAYGRMSASRRKQDSANDMLIARLRAEGKDKSAELQRARGAFQSGQYNFAQAANLAVQAKQEVVQLTANQLADRQDKINAALRKAVSVYQRAAMVPAADKAADSLLKMAGIYADRLKDPDEAMKTYKEIVRQFAGTAVAEDASWRLASYYEKQQDYAEAIKAYDAFLRNYRQSAKAPAAQFAIAENYEHLGEWVKAMDSYTNYINNYPSGPMVKKATQRREWIKTYRL